MKLLRVVKSTNPNKKWDAIFDDGTRTPFGAAGMDDYTLTHDKAQRERYRARHAKDLEHGTPQSAGYLSYYILWGDSTDMKTNIRTFKNRFHL
jgi:hypothetical protein